MQFRSVLLSIAMTATVGCSSPAPEPPAKQSGSPLRGEGGGSKTSTYRLVEQRAQKTYSLATKPTLYVIGETHLGKSQSDVARIAADA